MNGECPAETDSDSRPESVQHIHRRTPKRAYLMCVGGLFVGIFAGYSIGAKSIPPAALPTATAPRTLQGPTDTTIPGDGTFLVGPHGTGDVRPGLYHSVGNPLPCSWRRAKNATFERRALISSDSGLGDAYVELHAGEFFDTNDCTTWHRVTGPAAPR